MATTFKTPVVKRESQLGVLEETILQLEWTLKEEKKILKEGIDGWRLDEKMKARLRPIVAYHKTGLETLLRERLMRLLKPLRRLL